MSNNGKNVEIKTKDWVYSILVTKEDLWEKSIRWEDKQDATTKFYPYLVMKEIVRLKPHLAPLVNAVNMSVEYDVEPKWIYDFLLNAIPKQV